MTKVGIVTDSTCDLSLEEYATLGVKMVPLKVMFGDESYLDWIDMHPEEFFERLTTSPVLPKTSQPSPADFLNSYDQLIAAGAEEIVSIHLSAALSGTFESAMMAAKDCSVPVHVIDTKKVCQGVSMVVREACRAREEGLNAAGIVARAQRVVDSMGFFFLLDTMEYLVKGGRAGKATGLAASLLNIKPVLDINSDGVIEPFAKERGRKKAMQAIADHIAKVAAEKGPLRVAYLHACDEAGVKELEDAVMATGAPLETEYVGYIGAVIGTYAGPGGMGVAFYPVS